MRKRGLYILLPALAILLWAAAFIGHRATHGALSAARVASIIHEDLQRRKDRFEKLQSDSGQAMAWLKKTESAGASDENAGQDFELFAYQGDSLIAWSTSDVVPDDSLGREGKIYHLRNGDYYGYSRQPGWLPAGQSLAVLFPVTIRYTLSNQYLRAHFTAAEDIDPGTLITDSASATAPKLLAPDGRLLGYVYTPAEGSTVRIAPGWIVWCWAFALFFFCLWMHTLAVRLTKARRAGLAIMLVLLTIVAVRGIMYARGLPFHIGETALFSPRLYATSYLLLSLGDLLCNTLAVLWLVMVVATMLPVRGGGLLPYMLRFIVVAILNMLLAGAAFLHVWLIRSLVIDSIIPFDTAHLSSLDKSSLAGLLIASLLTAIVLIVATIVRKVTVAWITQTGGQIITMAAGFAAMLLLYRHSDLLPLFVYACIWLFFIYACQFIGRLRESGGLFRAANLIWSVAHCLLLTVMVQHFVQLRELDRRRNFAEHIATRQDDALEYNFSQIETYVRRDTALQHFLIAPTEAGRKLLDERLATLYFNNSFADYQAQTYLFDLRNRPLFNTDTTTIAQLVAVTAEEVPSHATPSLYYREAAPGDHIYIGIIDVNDATGSLLGVLFIDLEQKKIVAETVLPELLQPATINQAEKTAGYSYAVYADRKLVAQTSDYPFPFYITADTSGREYHERRSKDASTLIYTPDKHRTVLVWRRLGGLSEALTIFSYLLLLRFLLIGFVGMYRAAAGWVLMAADKHRLFAAMSLRRRVQVSVMGIVAFSFLLIGIITILFLKHRYINTNKAERQAMMQTVSRSIQQYVREQADGKTSVSWQTVYGQPRFRYFLGDLAASQKIDINLFDRAGRLVVATQQAIYDQGLLAPVMRPEALAAMYGPQPKPLLQQDEQIGNLSYISCYVPLRDESAEITGFLNVPLFSSQRELDEQISSVVVALLNLYVAIFLLSSILAVFITRWITSAFDVIIRQFGRLALHGNEPLLWPYQDEIGLLVGEYNKMVSKVEESVSLLAKSEREGAWREMARQVAHEIKNPLTPMKLNVQYLQQAIRNDQPNVLDLAKRVSENLLEQINNLSVIASEFADFARIGAKPEEIDLADVVRKVADLYSNEPAAEVQFKVPGHEVPVMADRSQLVRIVTNLMQNAVQAIPASRPGSIIVRLYNEQQEAVIEVADNGEGIPPDVQEKLFTPYFTTKTSGTGLGLAMTRQMVEVWGGTISYETAQGVGTTFIIRLPVMR